VGAALLLRAWHVAAATAAGRLLGCRLVPLGPPAPLVVLFPVLLLLFLLVVVALRGGRATQGPLTRDAHSVVGGGIVLLRLLRLLRLASEEVGVGVQSVEQPIDEAFRVVLQQLEQALAAALLQRGVRLILLEQHEDVVGENAGVRVGDRIELLNEPRLQGGAIHAHLPHGRLASKRQRKFACYMWEGYSRHTGPEFQSRCLRKIARSDTRGDSVPSCLSWRKG